MNQSNNLRIFDAHNHIFPEKISLKASEAIGKFYDIGMRYVGSSEHLLESAKNAGVEKMLVCTAATVPHQVESINTFISEECNKHSEFLGFGTMHPDFPDVEKEIKRIKKLGLHGVKLHPDFQKFNIDDRKAYPIYEQCEGKLPILFHMGDDRYEYSKPYRLAHIMNDFPKLQVIAAHFGGYRCWDEAIHCLLNKDNIMYDTSSTLGFNDIEYSKMLISKFDKDRLMFGTDFPMWDHNEELRRYFALGLSDEENEKILSKNFMRYFGIK